MVNAPDNAPTHRQLKISTLGGLSIHLDDAPVTGFVSRKVEALLVYIAANPREHPREVLGTLLWDDLPQARTMSYLRTALSSLQKQLAPFLQVTRQSIAINPDSNYWLDISALDTALSAAENRWQQRGTFTRAAAHALESALKLYKGTFLDGFHIRNAREFEGWLVLEQERLRSKVMDAYYRLGLYALERGSAAAGVEHVTEVLRLDPLREEAHRLMMRLLAQSGQRGAALAQYETVVRVLDEELGVEPEEQTEDLFAQIQAGEIIAVAQAQSPSNLPQPHTPFVDRPDDVLQILGQLEKPNCRLLTLVGAGGIGKSRLALEVARQQLPEFPHGVYFVSFDADSTPVHIERAIASVLPFNFERESVLGDALISYLRDREILLVLDNFEYLIESSDVLTEILQLAPSVKMLVTARERLSLREEWLYAVAALPIPTTTQDAGDFVAVRLFAQSARRVQPDFDLDANLSDVIDVCALVGGVPLALELAASWVRVMSPAQIVKEIERGLDILTSSLRNVPERHRSMRAVFESSWRMMTDMERQVFRRLSIFQGGFTQEAAIEVAGASLLTVSLLVDKSLLNPVEGRYQLHQLLRQFAAERLAENPEEREQVAAAHSRFYAAFMARNEEILRRDLDIETGVQIRRELENITVAWRYARNNGTYKDIETFITPIFFIYELQSAYDRGMDAFSVVVEHLSEETAPDAVLVRERARLLKAICAEACIQNDLAQQELAIAMPIMEANGLEWEMALGLRALGNIAYITGDDHKARENFQRVADIYAKRGDHVAQARTLLRLCDIANLQGNFVEAKRLAVNSMLLMERSNLSDTRTRYYFQLGDLDLKLGDYEGAQRHFEQARSSVRETKNPRSLAIAQVSLARVALGMGDYVRARSLSQESIDICRQIHNLWGEAFALTVLGRACSATGEHAEAKYHYRTAIAITERIHSKGIRPHLFRWMAMANLAQHEIEAARKDIREGLLITVELKRPPLMLEMLTGAAEVSAALGNTDEATRLAAIVAAHPISEYATRESARALLSRVGGEAQAAATDDPLPDITARLLEGTYR